MCIATIHMQGLVLTLPTLPWEIIMQRSPRMTVWHKAGQCGGTVEVVLI